MIAYSLIALRKFGRCVLLFAAMGLLVNGFPAAEAASPYDQGGGEGWQATSGNPYREAAPGEWAPSRNQLRETPPSQAATKPSQKATDPARQLQRPGEAAQTQTQSPTPKSQPATASAPTANTNANAPRWTLPNERTQTATASTPQTAYDSANREPRPFIPAANVVKMPSAAQAAPNSNGGQQRPAGTGPVSPAQQAHNASPAANRMASNNQPNSPQRYGSPPNPSGYVSGNSVARANKTRARQAAPKPGSYTSRLWQTVNVAFQAPAEWGESVEPEQLPLPNAGYSMAGEYSPHMGGEGCSDGSCYGGPGCGCGECGDACGCGDGCGDGMCGCEPGCGCGGTCEPGCGCEPSCGCGNCGSRDSCDGLCLGFGDDQSCHTIRVRVPKWQELLILGGVHGFKGPYDQDRDSGNFGFHEGINAGFKVPFTSLGYQIGYQAVHSQLNGDENQDISDSHTQHFTTVGLFHRTRDGIQGGVAWDMLSDDRFGTHDFHQLRGELSLIDRGCHELGAAVAVHLNEHEFFPDGEEEPSTIYRATNQYLLFYRFHACKGGEGRFYGGWTDDSDGIVGSDMLIPLTDRWSLNAAFTYLIPDEPSGFDGASQEAWNISTALVWHWNCSARKSHSNCYRPLFNVADNGYLIIDDRPGREPVESQQNGG
jgi:hypothetical protein